MIVRYHGRLTLMDCEALAVSLGRAPATIRKHCTPIACDWATWRQLYDADQASQSLAAVACRRPHQRGRTAELTLTGI